MRLERIELWDVQELLQNMTARSKAELSRASYSPEELIRASAAVGVVVLPDGRPCAIVGLLGRGLRLEAWLIALRPLRGHVKQLAQFLRRLPKPDPVHARTRKGLARLAGLCPVGLNEWRT